MLNVPNAVLQKIQAEGGFVAPNGERVEIANAGGVAWHLSEALYRAVREHRPTKALEVGMASGFSTLSILTAMNETGGVGTLVSIDPFQSTACRNAGRNHVELSGFTARHTVMEEPDYLALPKLLNEGHRFDFVYIDGNHDFEYVVLDFFYADQLLNSGGIIAFNDCGWKSVHAAMQHIPPGGNYEELDVGLKPDFKGGNLIASLERRLTGRSSCDRYFRKRAKR